MNKKILACDLDGTLLNSKSEVSNTNLETIKEFINKGNYFVISSGRPLFRVMDYVDLFNLDNTNNLIMCLNGGLIINLKDHSIVREIYLAHDDVKEILDFSKETKTDCIVYTLNTIHAYMRPQNVDFFCKLEQVKNYDNKEILYTFNNVHKIIFIGVKEELDVVKKHPRYNELLKKYNIVRSTEHYLEFLPKNVSKGIGLDIIREYLNVDKQDTFAMGDEENDLDMLLHAGVKITLENGNPIVKQISDYITPSNDEDGVSYAVKNIILK